MKTALITGGAARIGAEIAKTLHDNQFDVIIHYNKSADQAKALCDSFNKKRRNSAQRVRANLSSIDELNQLIKSINSIDLLVNNASVFYPTPLEKCNNNEWDDTMNINVRAPFILSKGLSKKLQEVKGCIINIVDIHAERPLKNYAIYNISKAGIKTLTKTLAKELAPDVRVCGVSPGSILWPEEKAELAPYKKRIMLERIALKRQGSPTDIAEAVLFLANANYITGEVINIDGGRSLHQ
ncbi:MAG: pteridine reductase [Gammaproteobacteria bacterium]|nr:pteridine reductase [Gammaproteobacteria bacterium]